MPVIRTETVNLSPGQIKEAINFWLDRRFAGSKWDVSLDVDDTTDVAGNESVVVSATCTRITQDDQG